MAATTKLHAAKQTPIPLKPFVKYHHYLTTRATTRFEVLTGTGNTTKTVTRKQDLPFAPNASDYKRLICTIDNFKEACLEPKHLNIKDKTTHKKAFDIISRGLHIICKAMLNNANEKTNNSFVTDTCTFVAKFLPSNAFLIQQ